MFPTESRAGIGEVHHQWQDFPLALLSHLQVIDFDAIRIAIERQRRNAGLRGNPAEQACIGAQIPDSLARETGQELRDYRPLVLNIFTSGHGAAIIIRPHLLGRAPIETFNSGFETLYKTCEAKTAGNCVGAFA